MAEAHQAVAFQFLVTEEGTISVRCDREAIWLTAKAFLGNYRSRYTRLRNAILRGLFPASPVSLLVILAITLALHWCGRDPTLIKFPWFESSHCCIYSLVLIFQSLTLWILLAYAQRYTLKGLLTYKGWMFDAREVDSTKTKLWGLVLKLVSGPSRPMLYSYQYSLPRLPVPSLDGTCKRLMLRKLIPLCSFQYKRLFGTCRIPGKDADKLVHVPAEQSLHVVAYRKGLWYKVQAVRKNRILTPVELECQFQKIWDSEGDVGPGEEKLAILTAHNRSSWAEARSEFFSSGVNRESMAAIESSAFIIFFDDSSPTIETQDGNSDQLTSYCKSLLHGTGYNNWFDKSISIRVFANGKMGVNAEHSWADAPITGHLLEYCYNVEQQAGYRPDGHCNGQIPANIPVPQLLKWDIPPQAVSRINEALSSVQACIEDLDLYVIEHNDFGKGDMKRSKLSPDAFIQMALQLSYFKDSGGKFCLTYEASMTRLFREGRTETVRPVSVQSADFVRAMCDPNGTDEERRRLLAIAADKHTDYYKLAMTGKGVDRHLFCLYVLSKYLKIESPFLAKVLGEPWRLSTSQTPTQFTQLIDYNKFPEKASPGGGFGPVTKDGYGVSYIIPGDHLIYFHVSSFKSSEHTDSRRFAQHIRESLRDMRALFIDKKKAESTRKAS
eukprot:Em0021g273a